MRDKTIGNLHNDVKQIPTPPQILRVLPTSGNCRSKDVREFMGWATETWDLWKESDPPLEVIDSVGTHAELVNLAVLDVFLNSRPKLPPRPNRKKPKK